MVNKRPATNPITIQLPNGDRVMSTHEAELNLPMLLPAARHVHLVPGLHECSLLSIGQLCDAGYQVIFNRDTMSVLLHGKRVLQGARSLTTKLWHVNLTCEPTQIETAAAAIDSRKTAELVAFAHATLFSPALSTLQMAIHKGI